MKENNRKAIARRARQRKQRARRVALTLCLIVATMLVSVGGTIAWLTATSGTVTNTFTTGDINITLEEYAYDAESNSLDKTVANAVTAISDYKVYPGAELPKEPFVTVTAGSEPCYVFVCVENNLKLDNGTGVATIAYNSKWVKVGGTDDKAVYKYTEEVDALNAAVQLDSVFTKVTIATESVTKANISQLKDDTIVINAYAHQSNATTEAAATTAALTHFGVTAA